MGNWIMFILNVLVKEVSVHLACEVFPEEIMHRYIESERMSDYGIY